MSLVHLDERLDERFRLLTGGPRTAQARQRTLRAMAEPGRTEEVLRIGAALHYFLWARCQRHAIEGQVQTVLLGL